jgi:hypothetical protein
MVDDTASNVVGAEAAGMVGHHYTHPASLTEALAVAGLLGGRAT